MQVYLDELLRAQFDTAKEWAYTGVGVLEWDVKMRDYLKNNNWQYPVVSRTGPTPEDMAMHVQDVVSLRDMVLSFEDPAATVQLLALPAVRIVSLTITEFGYRVPLNDGDFKLVALAFDGTLDGEVCGDDIDPACRGATVFGLILASLAVRFRSGLRPYTIMSCDNLPHNGEVAKKRVLGAAHNLPSELTLGDRGVDFVRWLEEEVKYPSTMVDRITPATSPQVSRETRNPQLLNPS
jgi:mannitol 2-dehydrogenase